MQLNACVALLVFLSKLFAPNTIPPFGGGGGGPLVALCLSTEVLSVTMPGGCRSQGCHGYLTRSLAAPSNFLRHPPHTHLLAMGLTPPHVFQ